MLRRCKTYLMCTVALCAIASSTVLVLFAGIAAACEGTGGGGGGCAAPSVSTGGYDALTSNSVTLTGSVNPQGCQTYYAFQYGRSSEGYPDEIVSSAGSGTSPVPVSTSSAIVQPGTSYHYRLIAWNSGDEVTGGSGSFTTPATCTKPTVTTEAASFVTSDKAFLNGKINPNGCSTSYTFEYGLAASGTYTKLTGSTGAFGSFNVWKEATGLMAGKLYTFRLWASNSHGKGEGSWLNFSTVGAPVLDPILFIHGYKADVGGWNTMISSFQQSGWPASSLYDWYYDWSQSNVTTANAIAAKVNHILSTTGKSKVDLISHSMGSLSARYYVKNLGGGTKVDDFVSLGGLNHGAPSWKLSLPSIGCSGTPTPCNEMMENSTFLNSLNSGDETPGPVWYMTVAADCDPVVSSSSVALAGARNEPWDAPLSSCVDTDNSSHKLLRSDSTVIGMVKGFVK